MEITEWIRFILGAALILCGLIIYVLEIYGVFHLKYVLNRMHAAAMGDTLGLTCCLLGLILFSGWNYTSLKMGLIVLFFWFASPVSSHMLSKLEFITNEELLKHCEVSNDLRALEKELEDRKEQE